MLPEGQREIIDDIVQRFREYVTLNHIHPRIAHRLILLFLDRNLVDVFSTEPQPLDPGERSIELALFMVLDLMRVGGRSN
jgi:hypothetical protein